MVIFFDIDGTILDTGGAGMAALKRSVAEAAGVEQEELPSIDLAGAVDRGIFSQLISKVLEPRKIASSPEALFSRYVDLLEEHLHSDFYSPELLSGAEGLLRECASRRDLHTGLITGNVARGAEVKLQYFGLWDSIDFGAYGDEAETRNEVARIGVQRALERGVPGQPSDWWILGDTVKDIRCARAAGVRAAVVATGGSTKNDLEKEDPDLLFDSLEDWKGVLREMGLSE